MAYDFNGTNSGVGLNTFAAIDTGDWTIAAMVKADTTGEGAAGSIVHVEIAGPTIRQRFGFSPALSGSIIVLQQFNTTIAQSVTNDTVPVGTGEEVALFGTFRASDKICRAYLHRPTVPLVEMAYSSQDVGDTTRGTGGTLFRIGNNSAGSRTWDGTIRNLVIDNREWSRAEMLAFARTGVPFLTPSLRGYFPLVRDSVDRGPAGVVNVDTAVSVLNQPGDQRRPSLRRRVA